MFAGNFSIASNETGDWFNVFAKNLGRERKILFKKPKRIEKLFLITRYKKARKFRWEKFA